THIPYRGAAPAMTDLLAGQVQLKMDTYATSAQHVAAGKLRALAYAGLTRSAQMPEGPTVAELGLDGYEGILWMGLVAPAGTAPAIVAKLAAATARAVKAPDFVTRLQQDGIDPVGNTPAEFSRLITREIAQWRDVVQAAKITADQ